MSPVVERETNHFIKFWNQHSIRRQKDVQLPSGVPKRNYEPSLDKPSLKIPVSAEHLEAMAARSVNDFQLIGPQRVAAAQQLIRICSERYPLQLSLKLSTVLDFFEVLRFILSCFNDSALRFPA